MNNLFRPTQILFQKKIGHLKIFSNSRTRLEATYNYANTKGTIKKLHLHNDSFVGNWEDNCGNGKIIFQYLKYGDLKALKLVSNQNSENWYCSLEDVNGCDMTYKLITKDCND